MSPSIHFILIQGLKIGDQVQNLNKKIKEAYILFIIDPSSFFFYIYKLMNLSSLMRVCLDSIFVFSKKKIVYSFSIQEVFMFLFMLHEFLEEMVVVLFVFCVKTSGFVT